MKTYKNWDKPLNEYLNIGDHVDEEFYNYFIDVLPPRTFRRDLVQMGEPYSHTTDGRATWPTLARDSEGWYYCGNCCAGEKETPKRKEF